MKKKIIKKARKISMTTRLKKEILELEKKLSSALEDKEYYRGKYDAVKNEESSEIKDYQKGLFKIKEEMSIKESEITFLRETLRLIVVPKGKLKEQIEAYEKQRQVRGMRY